MSVATSDTPEARWRRWRTRNARAVLAAVAGVVVVLALAPGAAGAATLDQQAAPMDNGGSGFVRGPSVYPLSRAQTLTAGLSGTLDRVDLYLDRWHGVTDPLTVEVRNVSGGLPGTTVLASSEISPSSVTSSLSGAWAEAHFATPAVVRNGGQYAIVAIARGADTYAWHVASPYSGGEDFRTYSSPPDNSSWAPEGSEYAFRTYVSPSAVQNTAPSCAGVTASPSSLLPATRDQFKTVALSGASDADPGDTLSYRIDGVSQDEPVSGPKIGDDTSPDAHLVNGGNSNQVNVRAERNPKGNGRVYRIAYTVTDNHGASCSRTIADTNAKVGVPRKKGQAAIDDYPASFNSLGS